jgi:hypothetical protein
LVVDDLGPVPATTLTAGGLWFRCYDPKWGYDEANPGYGDQRFTPFHDPVTGRRVPSIHVAATREAALLETVFRDMADAGGFVYLTLLRERALAHVALPRDARVADLRDDALAGLGVPRSAVVSSSPRHYPCTRRLAVAIHRDGAEGAAVDGIVWHSRQAELAGGPPVEVAVLFADRFGDQRGSWPRVGPGVASLVEGPGRVVVDTIATHLGATVV